ncbi:hypothetical protein GCM10008956_28700 [Deinococcus arenae]|uniref:Uncharacterized protein n=1 Tax=Deinococcus arenae TaxID=1452751 RepID=A0A8H9L7A5_9DEIO|nr:hypothetical protein [Deinococcus arenae]AWT34733.1 hypothetical protein DM785_03530 [Deinococcus actinosclerus]GGM50874.1 hypothetical protein GCM10008956_28700 [Deinococcus arenae]
MTRPPHATGSRRLGQPLPPADLLHLGTDGPHLSVHTPRGPLALYRFTPLQMALLTGDIILTAAQWPEHLKAFLYQYVPLPVLPPAPHPPPGLVYAQARDPHGLRTWDHTTYQGWPLYLYAHDHPGQPPGGEVPHLFSRVRLDQAQLPGPHHRAHGP